MTVVYTKGAEQGLEKSDGGVNTTQDPLFTVSGAPILVTEFYGIVTDTIAGASNIHLDFAVTSPAADFVVTTTGAIGTVIGTLLTFSVDTASVMTATAAGILQVIPRIAWLFPIGTLMCTGSVTRTGNVKWYMMYKQLSQYSKVIAAA